MKRSGEPDFSRARRGAVTPAPSGKTRITIRIDTDVLEWFRQEVHEAGGGSYQTLVNEALRQHVTRREGDMEEALRRVVRSELERVRRRKQVRPW